MVCGSGSDAVTTVPPPGGLTSDSVPPAASARSRSPTMPAAARRVGAAAAVVGHLAAQHVAVDAHRPRCARAAPACLTTFVSASDTM